MNDQWSIETHGNPLGLVRQLLREIWRQEDLAGMLVTMDADNGLKAIPRFITDPVFIDEINPFRPLMEVNTARLIPGMLAHQTRQRVASVLRPCELRALIEMSKHTSMDISGLITIVFDCLGTLPADEYQWRLQRLEKSPSKADDSLADVGDELAGEAMRFARQGGIIPYRYRSACQVCISPAAQQADININILGLPIRQRMLISFNNIDIAKTIDLSVFSAHLADESLVADHTQIVSRMCERHQLTMQRIEQDLGSLVPENVDTLINQLENCGDCQACLDVCPICSVDRPLRDADGHYERSSVMHWLVSCAGCGMCEQACPNNLPTSSIFAHIRQQLDQEWQYIPGHSLDEPLPNL